MAVFLSPVGGVAAQFFTNTGAVLTGGKLYTYAAGTTTPAATYTSASGTTFNTNPIVLDAAGRVPSSGEIWLGEGVQYKFVLKDSNDVLIASYDNITGINSNFVNYNALEEIQTATAGQTVFNLTNSYQPGTNTLSVFVDGVNQYDGSSYSYTETSSTRVTFTQGLHVGALVKFTTAVTLSAGVTTSNLVSYTSAGTGAVTTNVQAKLRQTVSVQDFGAVGDGTTDDTAAIQAALNSGAKNITFGQGGNFYCAGQLNIASNSAVVQLQGPATLLIDHAGVNYANSQYGIKALKKIALSNLTFLAQNTNYSNTVTAADGSTWTVNTRDFCIGFQGVEGTTIDSCRFENFYTAIRLDGTFLATERTQVTNTVTIQCGGGSAGVHPNMNFYACNDLLVTGHYAYIGDEITLPSNKKVIFTDNIIILPNKPAIDFGGSSATGYETDMVVITDNVVYGRDPIVCEFGGYKLKIADNICVVTMVQPNGIGIGVSSGASGSQAICDISITDNEVRLIGSATGSGTLASPISCGISVYQGATSSGTASTLNRVKISGNSINTAAYFGIRVDAEYNSALYGFDAMISDNYVQEATYGVYTKRINNMIVSDNNIRFATNAVNCQTCQEFVLKGNRTFATSGGTHYSLDDSQGTNNQVFIQYSNATTDTQAISVTNTSTSGALPYLESNVAGGYSTTRVSTGSITRNASPTTGGYIGQVCTSGGISSTVWKNYGLIA